jgi:hypothetical protein
MTVARLLEAEQGLLRADLVWKRYLIYWGSVLLSGQRLGALFWRRSEVNRRQKCTDQQHQQIDFHDLLRRIVRFESSTVMQKVFPQFNDSSVIRNG